MKRRNRISVLSALLIVVVAGVVAPLSSGEEAPKRLNLTIDRKAVAGPNYADVIERAAGSVVSVYSTRTIQVDVQSDSPLVNDPFLRQFFGIPDLQPNNRSVKQQALGSGVILTSDGYVVTTRHNISGADEIRIAFNNESEYEARIVGMDSKTDVALLKIDAEGLPAMTLTDSSKVRVGDLVFAIGNPFGVGQTVTQGIVSARGRGLGLVEYEDFIQTDAAINPGNSGGALIDAEGRLIGINTVILSRSGGNNGIGFAISANLAVGIMERLLMTGRTTRGYLGVATQDFTSDLQESPILQSATGVLVNEVRPGAPAAEAGVKAADIIIRFGDQEVTSARELRNAVASALPGTRTTITVIRDGKQTQLTVTLGEEPSLKVMVEAGTPSWLAGMALRPLSDDDRAQLHAPDRLKGLLITQIDPDSKLTDGLQPGDVVMGINGKRIYGLADAATALMLAEGSHVVFYIWRNGEPLHVSVLIR